LDAGRGELCDQQIGQQAGHIIRVSLRPLRHTLISPALMGLPARTSVYHLAAARGSPYSDPLCHRRLRERWPVMQCESSVVTVGYIASGSNLIGAPERSTSSRRRP
jgi:hypothetical protein